jgi:prepilin-type N-terminal cleavage/methylation domain-containing protein
MIPPRPPILVSQRRAFTLIELIVVVALAAIMATIVPVSLAGNLRAARAQDAAQTIATSDRLAREYARRFDRPVRLVFDLSQSTLTRAAADAPDSTLHLPSGLHIARLVTATTDTTSGQVTIPCSPAGQTPSYALLLTDGRGGQHWTITAGLTGQTSTASDENEVHEIFTALRPK